MWRDETESRIEAERLRGEADRMDRRAEEQADRNPMYAEYLSRVADAKRWRAKQEEYGNG